jgi:large subunit ribosomal protein L35
MRNKIKTHKATAKRFKLTGTGKVKRTHQQGRGNAHLKSKKVRSQKRLNAHTYVISAKGQVRRIKQLLNI